MVLNRRTTMLQAVLWQLCLARNEEVGICGKSCCGEREKVTVRKQLFRLPHDNITVLIKWWQAWWSVFKFLFLFFVIVVRFVVKELGINKSWLLLIIWAREREWEFCMLCVLMLYIELMPGLYKVYCIVKKFLKVIKLTGAKFNIRILFVFWRVGTVSAK